MKPVVVFPDPEVAVIDYLKARWLGRSEDYKPAKIKNSFPVNTEGKDVVLTGDQTHVQVELDGTPDSADYPMVERCTVRVTSWSAPNKPTHAKDLATRNEAFVYSHPGDDDVFSTKLLTGRLKGTDRDSGNQFVSFTARVNMRPTAL